MPDITNIMNQYLNTAMAPLDAKRSEVAAAAEAKKAALDPQGYLDAAARNVGYGNAPLDPSQPLDPISIIARAAGDSRYMGDAAHQRSMPQAIGDDLNSAAQALFMTPVEIGNLGVSAVSPDAGAAVTHFIQNGLDNAQTKQSDGLNARRRAYAARSEVTSDVNQQKYDSEVGADGAFIAGLRRVGRDAIDSIKNTDGVMASDLIANAAGSLVTSGPIGEGLGIVGKGALRLGMKAGAVGRAGARSALELGSKIEMPLSIGLQEAGGVDHQTAANVLSMSHEDLTANSPEYRDAIAKGMSPEEARNLVARNAGLEAAAIQFPLAAATGVLTSKFEKAPFKPNSLVGAGANVLKEGVEEGVQSGSGQLAQNIGTKDNANQNQDLLAGVGEQAGLGALGGIGSAGVTAAPGAVLKTAVDTVKGTVNYAANKVQGAYDALTSANEKASTVSDENVRSAVDSAVAVAPDVQAAAKDTPAADYVNNLVSATHLSPDEINDPSLPADIKDVLTNSKDRLDAVQQLAAKVSSSPEGSLEQLTAAATLYNTMGVLDDAIQQHGEEIDQLAADHPAKELVGNYQHVLSSIRQSKTVSDSLAKIDEIVQKANESGKLAPVEDAKVNTPEGQQQIRNTITAAEASPLNANPEANDKILYHAQQGNVQLTTAQRVALQASSSLVRAQQARQAELERLKLTSNQDVVTDQIISRDDGQETKTPSVAEHVKRIVAAARIGDTEATTEYLNSLVRFAQHMQNKVGALNEALSTGANSDKNTVKFNALMPNGNFRPVGKVYINPFTPGGVSLAQQVNSDADTVARVANDLVATFPDLGIKPVKTVELDKSLTAGTAQEVAQAYRDGRVNKAPDVKSEPAPKQEASTTESKAKDQPKGGDQSAEATVTAEAKPAPEETAPVQEKKVEDGPQPEQKSEQSPAVEAKPETSPTEAAKPAPAEADAGGTGTTEEVRTSVLDKLPTWSSLKKAFRIPDQAKTRIVGESHPIETIRNALSSAKAFQDFLGSKLKHNFTPEIAREYGKHLSLADGLMEILVERLAKSSEKARFLKGDRKVAGYRNGRVLNLTEEVDGDLVYNQQLLESATLAALQWALISDNFHTKLDKEDVLRILKAPDAIVTDEQLKQLNEGLGLVEAKRSLARMIQSYWGLSSQNNAPTGQIKGVAEAMAAEFIEALQEAKGLTRSEVNFTEADGLPKGEKRTVYVYTPREVGEDNPINAVPNAIEQAVLTNPEQRTFIGEPPTEIAKTQLRNSKVKLTDQQTQAIGFEQKQPHYANLPMVKLFGALGLDNILKLFGAGDLDGPMNEQDRKSKEGLNLTFASAFASLNKLMAELTNMADVAGTEADQLPIFYDYVFTRVNRMQMLGLNNPQASKLMREAILPTRATVDLSNENSEQFSNFALALGQALGIKVHSQMRDEMFDNISEMLATRFEKSVEILQDWLKNQDRELTAAQVDTIASELGSDASPVALHALTEFARYQNADAAGRKAFTTSLYVEADGVTNGPANTMVLLTPGRFTPKWLKTVRKVGLFLGSKTMTMNEHRQSDNVDLYEETTITLSSLMAKMMTRLRGEKSASYDQLRKLNYLMGLLLPGDVKWDGTDLSFKRGIAKNPLTITIYGAGAKGIAGNVADALTNAFYEKMSEALSRQSEDKSLSLAEAMFPGSEDPELELKKLNKAMNDLTTKVVKKNAVGFTVFDGHKTRDRAFDPAKFQFDAAEFNNLRQNLLTLFVEPLRSSINETIGESLDKSTTVLRKAIQVQSIVLEYAFKQKVEQKLAEKAKDPEWNKEDFLSQDELNSIFDELRPLAPIIDTGAQRFYIANSQSSDMVEEGFGSSLGDKLRTPGELESPSDAGVAGIPSMVIGSGDGLMMQILSTMPNAPERTLKVFDGMHLPLDGLTEGAQKANQAVYESWQGNPLQAVSNAYTAFLGALELGDMGDAQLSSLAKSLGVFGDKPNAKLIEKLIQDLGPELENMSNEIEARHRAMARVGLTVDQMAGIGVPFVNEGEVSLEGLSDEQAAVELNRLYNDELDKLSKGEDAPIETVKNRTPNVPVKKVVSENIAPELETVGRVLKSSGVRIVSHTALAKLVRVMNIPADQKAQLRDIVRTLVTKEYKIVYGSQQQVDAYAAERGLDLSTTGRENQLISGICDPIAKTIYLYNPSSEVLLHELIHAATYEKVWAFYNGGDLGPNSVEQVRAIQNIEVLMDQFMGLSMHGQNEETQRRFFDTTDEIEFHLNRGDKAAALNEFMAYALSISDLIKLQKQTAANPLVQLARKVIAAIKQLVAGKRHMPVAGEDMFSKLRFNTAVLMQTKYDARRRFARTALFHSSSYGNNDRLSELNKALFTKIYRHLDTTITGPDKVRQKRIKAEAAKIFASTDAMLDVVDQGFKMTPQERSTAQLLVSTMSTAVDIDTNVLTRVQEIYTHVTKNLTVEDFMKDPNSLDPADRYYAQQKFDVIVGNNIKHTDALGRSSLLPVFLALAVANEEFRTILSKMDVPRNQKKAGNSFDAVVENVTGSVMDKLSDYMTGDRQDSPHIQASIDALMQRVVDTTEDRESFFEQMTTPLGNAADSANEWLVGAMQKLAEKTFDKAEEIKSSTSSKTVKAVASLAKGIAAIVDERTGSKVAEGLLSEFNRGNLAKPLHEFLNDLIGRTESNASIYDMIKLVRDRIQQHRQQFREHLPKVIASKFTRKVTVDEWSAMHAALGKTDIAALRTVMSKQQILDIVEDPKELKLQTAELEKQLQQLSPDHFQKIQEKAKQLANFMNTGEYGKNLLRNAKAVANLFNEGVKNHQAGEKLVAVVDQLTTLYAYDALPQTTKDTVAALVETESEGLNFVVDYLVGQRKDELAKTSRGYADVNHYKGAMPTEYQGGMSLIVANDSEHAKLAAKSFIRIGEYGGSSADRTMVKKSYYFAPVSGRSIYNQGLMQNVRATAYGIDLATGYTHGMTAGRIEDPVAVNHATRALRNELASEPLAPVFDSTGKVIAYERTIDPKQLGAHLTAETNLAKVIGIWRGRQLEELEAQKVNETLIDNLNAMYQRDIKESPSKKAEYINIRDPRELKRDRVLADAVKLFSSDTHSYIDQVFGNEFYVRRDMLNDALGYHSASVGDAWTENSRLPSPVLSGAQKLAMGVFGNDAYRKMVNAEKTIQNLVSDARVVIVVKSVVVPVTNLIANIYQLASRGISIGDIVKGMPRKTVEVSAYLKSRLRLDEIEAELRAEDNANTILKLKAEAQSIEDAHKRMSIWPLIEAGEFSSISDGTLTHDDLNLTQGRFSEWVEKKIDQLPEGPVRDLGRYMNVSRDTALHQVLQKSVEYGDFLAKAVLYDHLTQKKKLSSKDAMARVTEEFVNYDRLPGRSRGYLESMGMLWFWNFKVRSTKVALSMIRNNPVHALLTTMAPHPTMFGSVGSPIEDNVFAMYANGRLGWSVGPGMGLRAWSLNPWMNLLS